jgi:hypothetical protein
LASIAVAAIMTIAMPTFWRLRLTASAHSDDAGTGETVPTDPGPDDGIAAPGL